MNTPRRTPPDDAAIAELASAAGFDPARLTILTDPQAAELRDYAQLTDVRLRSSQEAAHGLYIAESTKIIERALAAGHVPRSLLMTRDWARRLADTLLPAVAAAHPKTRLFVGDDAVVEELTGYHLHRGALASMERPASTPLAEALAGASRIVVVEDLVDHTNLGAIFRSAAGLGVDAVLLTPRSADPLYRRAIRVSMGTVFQVPWARLESWPGDMEALRAHGFHLAALALEDDSVSLRDFAAAAPERVAVIMGTEGDGLSRRTIAAADSTVLIPMAHGVDSLNVAAATAVACYALQIEE